MAVSPAAAPPRDSIDILCDNFNLASADYVHRHKSRHWDVFASDYGSRISDREQWPDFRNNGLTAGFDIGFQPQPPKNRDRLEIADPRRRRDVVARYRSLQADIGEDFIHRYHEAEIGRPECVHHDGLKLCVTDLRHLHDAWRIDSLWPYGLRRADGRRPVILEIGGGFGGLAAKLKRLFPDAFVILLDLPEVNAAQTYFLDRVFPDARTAYYEDFRAVGAEALMNADYDFAVLPGWTVGDLPDATVDLAVNTRSMMEMNKSVVDDYMAAVNRLVRCGGVFYCVNRYVKSTVGEPIRIKDYAFDGNWYCALSAPAWDQPWIHELALVRTERPNAHPPARTLAALPPYTWADLARQLRRALQILKELTWGGHHNVNPGIKGRVFLWRRALERAAVGAVKRRPFLIHLAARLRGRHRGNGA